MEKLTDQLLAAIRSSGKSLHSLATEAGVHYASLHGFVNDGRKISLETAGKLAKVLGLTFCEDT